MLNSSLKPYEDLPEESSQSKINFAIKNLKEIKINLSDKDQAKSIDLAIDGLRKQKKLLDHQNYVIGYYLNNNFKIVDFVPYFIIEELI